MASNTVYAQFGKVKFAVTAVSNFSETAGFDYAEHNLASGKNALQAVGQQLNKVSLVFKFRSVLGHNINQSLEDLKEVLAAGEAQRLIFADGAYQGKFALQSIGSTIKRTNRQGEIVEADVSVNLIEKVDQDLITYKKIENKPPKQKPKPVTVKKQNRQTKKEERFYITKAADRWDNISYIFYADASHVEELRNANPHIPFYFTLLPEGEKIKIPEVKKKSETTQNKAPWA